MYVRARRQAARRSEDHTMKRWLALLVAALILGGCFSAMALADEVEVAPPSLPVTRVAPPVRNPASGRTGDVANSALTLTPSAAPSLGKAVTWSCSLAGGISASSYHYQVCLQDTANNALEILWYSEGEGSTFTYTCYQPGRFHLYADAVNANGTVVASQYTIFDVADDPGAVSLSKRVSEVAAQCKSSASGDYAIALWLHDWIVNHCYYDLDNRRFAAEDLFFSGVCVCDGYSKAYQLLLQACGLQTMRVTGGSHAWNAVRINGDWVHVDTTWDDPSGASTAVSGQETHNYFGLNDAIMQLDHTYTPPVACTSLAHCYAYKTGEYRTWLYYMLTDPSSQTLNKQLSAGFCEWDGDTKGKAVISVGSGGRIRYYNASTTAGRRMLTLGAALLQMDTWNMLGSYPISLKTVYNASTYKVHVSADLSAYTLKLPGDVTRIEAGAFQGDTGVLAVELGENVNQIGESAFSGCSHLLKVVAPASQMTIASNAFTGAHSKLTFFCAAGSAAETFARGKGFSVYHP